MRRRIVSCNIFGIGLLFCFFNANAQSADPPKFEVGAEFVSITKTDVADHHTEAGLGGRFTFNLNKNVAFEAAGYYFPNRCFTCERANGTLTEGLFGIKAGKRFEKWGIFGKARPGFASFSQGAVDFVPNPPAFNVEFHRVTNFALDLGAVVEFYPSKRIVTRFDAGDTLIRFRRQVVNYPLFDPTSGNITFILVNLPATTRHNFQFSAGVGFRF
jgi:hypothetical protein